jgi:hypothetical protein
MQETNPRLELGGVGIEVKSFFLTIAIDEPRKPLLVVAFVLSGFRPAPE